MPRRRGSQRSSSNSSGRSARRGSSSNSVALPTPSTSTSSRRGRKAKRGRGGSGKKENKSRSGRSNDRMEASSPSTASASSSSSEESPLYSNKRSSASVGGKKRRADTVREEKTTMRAQEARDTEEPKVPLAEPVEQRWEQSAGKYLHKKFKKIAAVESNEEPTASTGAAATSEPPSVPIPATTATSTQLIHSVQSMLSQPQRPQQEVSQLLQSTQPQQQVQQPKDLSRVHLSQQPQIQQTQQNSLDLVLCPLCRTPHPVVEADQHIRAHCTLQVRPHRCEPCRFGFRLKSSLDRHLRSRTHLIRIDKGELSHALDIVAELGEAARDEAEAPLAIPHHQINQRLSAATAQQQLAQQQQQQHPQGALLSARSPIFLQNQAPSQVQVRQPTTDLVHSLPKDVSLVNLPHQQQHLQQQHASEARQTQQLLQRSAPAPVREVMSNATVITKAHDGRHQQLPPSLNLAVMQHGHPPQQFDSPRLLLQSTVRGHDPASLRLSHPQLQQASVLSVRSDAAVRQQRPVLVQTMARPPGTVVHMELHPRLPTAPLPLTRPPAPAVASPAPVESSLATSQTGPTDLSAKSMGAETIPQRIDKVISENQAIVETLDPLWPRRYMRQTSKDGEDKGQGSYRGARKYSTSTLSSSSSSTTSVTAPSVTNRIGGETLHVTSQQQATALLTSLNASPARAGKNSVPQALVVPASIQPGLPKAIVTLQPQAEASPPISRLPTDVTLTRPSGSPLMLVRQKTVQKESDLPTPALVGQPDQRGFAAGPPPKVAPSANNLGSAQSVKEVWINSCKKTAAGNVPLVPSDVKVTTNMAQLVDIASTLEQSTSSFHPSNPEGSMIKELLIKLKNPNQQNQPTVIEIKSSTAPAANPAKAPHVVYADPSQSGSGADTGSLARSRILSPPTQTEKCDSCSSVIRAGDLAMHQKHLCSALKRDLGPPLPKVARLSTDITTASSVTNKLAGGSVKSVINHAIVGSQGLLQIAQPALQSGGGIVQSGAKLPSATISAGSVPVSIVSSAAFSIPGVPTPSLSGVLTGIKSAPLFSLTGKRLGPTPLSSLTSSASETEPKPVPFILGMPGPYSQGSSSTVPRVVAATAGDKASSTTSVTQVSAVSNTSSSIPTITVSPASTTAAPADTPLKVKTEENDKAMDTSEDTKFLRPSSLALAPGSFKQKKHVMVATPGGSTLISPETPRPRKSYALTYQNGTAYTHLGLKCSTKPYFCSVFRQQPMYVHHKARLSMYSNWKVVTKDSHPSRLTPKESLDAYNSVYHDAPNGMFVVAGSKKKEVMIVAHSSQWKDGETKKATKRSEKKKSSDKEGTAVVEMEMDATLKDGVAVNKDSEAGDDDNFDPTTSSSTSTGTSSAAPHSLEGGYKTTDEEYTYVRGRGRGRYVCASCGIRCKKPSMLKKHIRSHSDFRPYTCRHCNFSFKTKGNLTKHMKSKAHHKKCVELGITPVPTAVDDEQDGNSHSLVGNKPGEAAIPGDSDSEDLDDEDEDDEDDDQYEDADEGGDIIMGTPSTSKDSQMKEKSLVETFETNSRQWEGLTAKRPKPSTCPFSASVPSSSPPSTSYPKPASPAPKSTAPTLSQLYEYAKVSKMNDLRKHQEHSGGKYYFNSSATDQTPTSIPTSGSMPRDQAAPSVVTFLTRPPPQTVVAPVSIQQATQTIVANSPRIPSAGNLQILAQSRLIHPLSLASGGLHPSTVATRPDRQGLNCTLHVPEEPKNQTGNMTPSNFALPVSRYGSVEILRSPPPNSAALLPVSSPSLNSGHVTIDRVPGRRSPSSASPSRAPNPLPLNLSASQPSLPQATITPIPSIIQLEQQGKGPPNVTSPTKEPSPAAALPSSSVASHSVPPPVDDGSFAPRNVTMNVKDLPVQITLRKSPTSFGPIINAPQPPQLNTIAQMKAATNASYANRAAAAAVAAAAAAATPKDQIPKSSAPGSVSLPLMPVVPIVSSQGGLVSVNQDGALASTSTANPSALPIKKPDKLTCENCQKTFPNAARLRDHMNIHYMERPFKCTDCQVSFRTQGHLTKHQRSSVHRNKVNINQAFGTPSTSNPRPFKCGECVVKFRIHGHLAKHLRSKSHIMKLECSNKLRLGFYADVERLGINLNDIDTTDPDTALKSLQAIENALDLQKQKEQHSIQALEESKPISVNQPGHQIPSNSALSTTGPSNLPPPPKPEVKTEPPDTLGPGEVPGALPMRREDLQQGRQLLPGQAGDAQQSQMQQLHQHQHPPAGSFFRNPAITGLRRSSFSSGHEDRSTDSETESGSHGSSSSQLQCQHCTQVFSDMKSLQIHIFVEHHATPTGGGASSASSASSPSGTRSSATPPVSATAPHPPPPPPNHLVTQLPPRPPTFHNGELLAAARIVNMQQPQQSRLTVPPSPLRPPLPQGGTLIQRHPPPAVTVTSNHLHHHNSLSSAQQQAHVAGSREGSVASSSETDTDDSAKTFNCDLCGAVLPSRNAFRQHLVSHAAPRPFVCSECDAGFTTGQQLDNHMKLHAKA